MPIQVIETRRIYQQIADQLWQMIESGEFPVDSRLPSERELAEKFKVSRPSVREALIALEVAGLVQIRMGSGVYVCQPSEEKQKGRLPEKELAPFELIQARHLIESEIAAQAAISRSEEALEELDQLLKQMIHKSKNNENPLDIDREFHIAIGRATGNQVLSSLVEQMFDARLGVLFSRLANYFDTQKTWDSAIKEHKAILKAIKQQDPDGAREAMRHHMERAYNRFSVSWSKSEKPKVKSR